MPAVNGAPACLESTLMMTSLFLGGPSFNFSPSDNCRMRFIWSNGFLRSGLSLVEPSHAVLVPAANRGANPVLRAGVGALALRHPPPSDFSTKQQFSMR